MSALRSFAVMTQKGGAGKTTTAVTLGAAFVEHGLRVLLVDLDAQAHATRWITSTAPEHTLRASLTEGKPLPIVPSCVPGLDVAPADHTLAGLDRALLGEPGAELLLRERLEHVDGYGAVIVDCGPGLNLSALLALSAIRSVIVPVQPAPLDLDGLAELRETIARVRARLNPQLELGAVLLTRVQARRTLSRDVERLLREQLGPLVLEATVPESVRCAEAPGFRQDVLTFAPRDRAAAAYRRAAAELLERTASKPRKARARA